MPDKRDINVVLSAIVLLRSTPHTNVQNQIFFCLTCGLCLWSIHRYYGSYTIFNDYYTTNIRLVFDETAQLTLIFVR